MSTTSGNQIPNNHTARSKKHSPKEFQYASMAVQTQRHPLRPSSTLSRQDWNVTTNVCDSVTLHVKATSRAISQRRIAAKLSRDSPSLTPNAHGLGPAQKWLQHDWAFRLEAIYSSKFSIVRWVFLFSQLMITFSRAHIVILTAFSACMYLPNRISGEQTNLKLSGAR